MITVAERLATTLANYATEVFGLMGNGNAFLIDAMLRLTPSRYTAVRHEVATVASADAYFRATRKLAIATSTYGAGFTNTLTALAEASQSSTPLILVVGDAPTGGARPWDVDQEAMAAACGVPTITVTLDAPGKAAVEACRIALEERHPVVLAIPYDLPQRYTDEAEFPARHLHAVLPGADERELDDVAKMLVEAERPVILAGRGALEARESLTALADALGAITVTTAPARGTFHGRALDAGVCGGFSSPTTAEFLGQADVVLAVGAGLNQFTMGFGNLFSPDVELIQFNLTEHATNPAVTTFVQVAAEAAAPVLLNLVEQAAPRERWAMIDRSRIAEAQFDRGDAPELAADGRLDPRGLMRALDERIPAERLITQDGGHFIGWANTHLHLPGPDSMLLVGTQYQSIGLGFSNAPGAARAVEDGRMLVLITGDGGGLMAIADLESTVRTAKRATVVVINDSAYTAEVTQYGSLGLQESPMLIPEVDFATMARGVGARASVVRSHSDLDEYTAWAASGGPGTWLLDCRVSGEVIAPYQQEIMGNLRASVAAAQGR